MTEETRPLVSVVMPVHNGAAYLLSAINSIRAQQYTHWELIIINDGSTDDTVKLVQSVADERFTLINLPRQQGIVAALNTGIAAAKGKYIARMDADDESLPQRFAQQVAFMEAHPETGVLGTQYQGIGGRSKALPLTHDDICWFMFNASPFVHPSVMMRRSLFEAGTLRYDAAFQYAEDLELWTRAAAVTRLANLPRCLIRYRYHQGTHQRFLAQAAQLNTRIREQYLPQLFPGMPPQEISHLAVITNRHLSHPYSLEWFHQLLQTLHGLPREQQHQQQAYNQCLWFHLASAPKYYRALRKELQQYPWVQIPFTRRVWLLLKPLLKR